jgi:hypothetical protein
MIVNLPHSISLEVPDTGVCTAIVCDEMQGCPGCGTYFCLGCDNSDETDQEIWLRVMTNCRIEGVLSFIQHCHSLGMNIDSEDFHRAIRSAFNDINFF